MIRIYCGYDPREAVAYHVFCNSVLSRTKAEVSFIPVRGERRDGSNDFTYSRFLVPWMCNYQGWAIWADGDMLCRADIEDLWRLKNVFNDVLVAKHRYKTKHPVKYLGQKNEDYDRKNWSSLMLINCEAPAWKQLNPTYVARASGAHLHRFRFLNNSFIGSLPLEWNWLVSEYGHNPDAKIAHYTIGIPPFYPGCDYSDEWDEEMGRMQLPSVARMLDKPRM